MTIELGSLWAAAGVLLGLQLAAFTLRVNREMAVGETGDRKTWLPLADGVNIVSLVVTVCGVFVAPVLDLGGSGLPAKAFGLGLLLLAGYPFALAGHYDMFNPTTGRSTKGGDVIYCPRQERIALTVTAGLAIAYVALAATR